MSLLWTKVAAQWVDGYMSHEELAQMPSNDYGVPMHQVRQKMREEWEKDQAPDSDFDTAMVHQMHRVHDGPDAYLDHMKKDIAANGIQEPLVIRNGKVHDGHHRGLAAMDLKMDQIPWRSG
jgi:hypothetical protein